MQPNLLQQFSNDKHTKGALLEYLIYSFQAKIIEKAMKKENVESLADACLEITKAFEQLDIDYGPKSKPKLSTNDAR